MRTGHRVVAMVGLLAISAGGFCLGITPPHGEASSGSGATASATLPDIGFSKKVAAAITKVELTQGQPRQEVTLEREGPDWWVTSPVRFRASASKMTELIENLRALRITEATERGTGAFEVYQLTDSAAFHVVAWNGHAKVSDLYFGRSDTFKRFARIGDLDGVFAVADSGPGGYLGFLYTRDLRNWRETSILHFRDSDAVEVEIINRNGRLSFLEDGTTWSGTFTLRDGHGVLGQSVSAWPRFDESKVKDLLRAFQSLSADDFGDERQRAASGVDHADETGGIIRIKFAGGTSDCTMRVGSVSTHEGRWAIRGSRWATLDGDRTLYVLAPWTAEWALANAGKFETPGLGERGTPKASGGSGAIEPH